jgi:hypothetical protein
MIGQIETGFVPMLRKAAAKYRDFASFLGDLTTPSTRKNETSDERARAASPSLQVDLLDQLERLQGAGAAAADEPAMAQYREMAAALEEVSPRVGAPEEGPSEEEPSVDPDDIARELGIAGIGDTGALARLRRDFAMRNHPDRVPAAQRERAEIRMRVANMLVDEARARIATAGKRRSRAWR